jgi:psp operon transcriptional activator
VPPLRERVEDILPLAYAFAINMASELKRELFHGFGPRASSSLLRHDWPGNVRELKNTIERSVYREPDPEKLIAKIAFDPFDSPFQIEAPAMGPVPRGREKRPPLLPMRMKERLEETEQEFLRAALEKARFNQSMAAELLDLSYHQFRGKLRKYGISTQPR